MPLWFNTSLQAQVAPSILIEPWPENPAWAQTVDQVQIHGSTDVEQDGSEATLFTWDSSGRVKFNREDRDPNVVVGYRYLNVSVDADRADVDGAYNDVAVAGGFKLGEWNGWDVAMIAGAGSANDDHWREGDALYGVGVVHLSRELSAGEQFHMGVSYDGNRTFLPDVPLPYFSYVNTTDPKLTYVLGLPASSVTWRPTEAWELSLRYTAPLDLAAAAGYRLTEQWSLFAEYARKLDAFTEHDEATDHQRLFFRRSAVSAGVRYEHPLADVSLGVGYAFDQEFSRGWDARDTDGFIDLEDDVFVMLTVRGTF